MPEHGRDICPQDGVSGLLCKVQEPGADHTGQGGSYGKGTAGASDNDKRVVGGICMIPTGALLALMALFCVSMAFGFSMGVLLGKAKEQRKTGENTDISDDTEWED